MKTKRILLGLAFALVLTSCRKDDDYYYSSDNCNCGKISNDGITGNSYWIEVRNNCSGNKKRFTMDADLWMNAHIGDMRCYSFSW
jgi:hypothetical protein